MSIIKSGQHVALVALRDAPILAHLFKAGIGPHKGHLVHASLNERLGLRKGLKILPPNDSKQS